MKITVTNNKGNNMSFYMVRAYNNQFSEFFENDIVAVGWSKVDFSSFTNNDKLIEEVKKQYNYLKNRTPSSRGKTLNQIRRFKSIKKSDKILIPYYSSICLASNSRSHPKK